jgi:hypothetical protein
VVEWQYFFTKSILGGDGGRKNSEEEHLGEWFE